VRERRLGDEIVRKPVGQLGERIRRKRCNDEQVGARQVDINVLGP
jgi:hypothetical protein